MRHAPSSNIKSGKVFWATLLACCLQAAWIVVVVADDGDQTNSKAEDENPQMDGDMPKRDWNQNLQMWGKRGWNNLHGGWGLKRSAPSWADENDMYSSLPIVEKRAWQSLQGGWGKRFAPDDEVAIEELASALAIDADHNSPLDFQDSSDIHDEEKRNWNKFHEGWGKRSKWENFRGSWGKRDPSWSNLKGIWGKRSEQKQFLNY